MLGKIVNIMILKDKVMMERFMLNVFAETQELAGLFLK